MKKQELSERRILRGGIRNYRVRRTTEDFFFSASERRGMAATGLAASAMGLLGVGVALMGESTDTYEEADLAEFEVEGEPVQAFLWLSPFAEGDEVEVVAERVGTVWKAFGIARPVDRIIAMRPHCSRGSKAHWKMVARWCFLTWGGASLLVGILLALINVFDGGGGWFSLFLGFSYGCIGALIIFSVIAWSVGRKYIGFVRMTEIVFGRLGWRDVENIDLPAKSRRLRRPEDPDELGFTYFRY
ncbi:putative type VI secretion system effector [Pseudoxanthomonas mexicana]|uniref:putative type VI secretion system effector n=1 Tax=Pseudoxanthomonas mexicana TaxID=128785 RepID=UPI00398AEC17